MIYNVAPSNISNGMNAENVLFQADYTSSATGTTQSLVRHPNGTTSWDPVTNRLFLKDRSNYRILEFSMIRITKPTVSNGNIGVAYADTITTESATGTSQDFSVFSGVLPPGLSLNTATGVISGTPTTATTSTFSIKATDNFSTGPIYNVVSYTMSIASTTPGSPTALSATTGLNQAVVSFTPPTSDGGTPITSYTVTSSPGGITATGSASPITVTGLSVSTTYTFTVVATNEAGNSVASAPSNPITTYSLGNGPVVGGGSISLPWEAKPRPQIVYPDGRVVYTDTATTTTSTTTTPVLAPVLATSTVTVPNTTTPSGITSTFTRDLKFDDSSSDVKQLQIFFNTHGFTVATTGPGAPGEETTIFGKLTKAAVIKFQETYASEILAQFGLTNGTGFVGPATRAKILQLLGR
jgi:hypothetical protein